MEIQIEYYHDNLKLNINWKAWEMPEIFKLIQAAGNITNEEMRKVFNLGIGLIAVVDKVNVESTIKLSRQLKEEPIIIGEIV